MMNLLRPLLLTAALGAATPLPAQPAAAAPGTQTLVEASASARAARLKGDVPNWISFGTKALALAPGHPDILVSVARAHAANGNKAKSLALLEQAARRGAGLDPARFAEFKALLGDPQFEAAAALTKRNLLPVARATTFAELPDRGSEGIAYDPVSHRFFVGTSHGELLAVGSDGKHALFAAGGGLRENLGLKVDPERRLLWVVNGRYPDPVYTDQDRPADAGTGGVRAYDLDSGKLVRSVELDERPRLLHGFNDIALARDGTVYVTDSNTSAVYRLSPGASTLDLLIRDAGMSFPNGIAMAPERQQLYVAHAEGISLVDRTTGGRTLLPVRSEGAVTAIDGLLLRNGVLYGVQNSPYLHRIVAAALSADGRAIERVWTVNSRTPAEYLQTTAAIAGEDLYMIGGAPMPDVYGGTNPAKPTQRIWRVPLKP